MGGKCISCLINYTQNHDKESCPRRVEEDEVAETSQESSGQGRIRAELWGSEARNCSVGQRYEYSAGISASACKTELLMPTSFSSPALSEVKQHKTQCRKSSVLKVLWSRQFQSMPRTITSKGSEFGEFFVAGGK